MDTSLAHYAACVRRTPRLDEVTERELARRWRQTGDQAARNRLVQSQLGLVLREARQQCRANIPLGELIAEGNVGLMHAVDKFDPERGFRLFTYAKHWVRVYVSECAIRHATSSLHDTRALRRVRRELARAMNLVGIGAEANRMVAERLGISAEQLDGLLCLLEQREVSFEALSLDQGGTDAQLYSEQGTPEQTILQRNESELRYSAVRAALATLDARELRIVVDRLMVDEEAQATLKQLGKEFGVSRERVRQLEQRLKRKLAARLEASTISETRSRDAAA